MKKGFNEIPFEKLSLDEQIKWIEKQTEKVVKDLPKLKETLSLYNDNSDELYNQDESAIRLMSKSHIMGLKSGTSSQGLKNYIDQLKKYSGNIGELEVSTTSERIDSFLNNVKEVGSEEEYEYAKSLIDNMSDEQKQAFVRSKFFFDKGNLNSDDFVKFLNDFGISVGTANLETFCEYHGIETEQRFYEEGDTYYKRGRHTSQGKAISNRMKKKLE